MTAPQTRLATPFAAETGLLSDPVSALAHLDGAAVLCLIVGVDGPSYRDIGASMVVRPGGARLGELSSGCIDGDISLHAAEALETGCPVQLRYGAGSPFADIRLPCGGGLDILLLPHPDRAVLAELDARRARREVAALIVDTETGAMSLEKEGTTGLTGTAFTVRYDPPPRFIVIGKGPAATTFAALVRSGGYPHLLVSPDEETLELAAALGCETAAIVSPRLPPEAAADPWTAVTLFFHDHEWEPPILAEALSGPAFYIGAQGSRRTAENRLNELMLLGVDEKGRSRVRGPIGLIPSSRDPRTLAVSVLAEVLAVARERKD